MTVKECERSYPVNIFEKLSHDELFEFYKKQGSPLTMRLEDDQNNVMIIKYFQLLENIGGMNSLTEDDKHVGFIDVEDFDLKSLIDNLKRIQDEFNLSTFYILRSSKKKNFHCICLDKESFGFWIDVLKEFSNEKTLQYQRFAVNRGRFVLRITMKGSKQKPKLIKILKRSNTKTKSWAHWYFLNLRYKIPKPRYLDLWLKIQFENYTTVKK